LWETNLPKVNYFRKKVCVFGKKEKFLRHYEKQRNENLRHLFTLGRGLNSLTQNDKYEWFEAICVDTRYSYKAVNEKEKRNDRHEE